MRMCHIVICAPLYNIFPHYLINCTILGKNVTKQKKCVSSFSTTSAWHIYHSKKNRARDDHKWILVFKHNTRLPCQVITKLEFSLQIFERYSNIKFNKNTSSGSRVVPCGRTDWHDEANSSFSLLCGRTKNHLTLKLLDIFRVLQLHSRYIYMQSNKIHKVV